MAELKDKVQNALDEARMLVLGSQVLLGFQFKSALETGFDKLPVATQYLKMGGLSLLVFTLALLMAPAPFHQLVEKGEDTLTLHRYATGLMRIALLPFAVALGIDAYAAGEKLGGFGLGLAMGAAVGGAALFFWYGLEAIDRVRHAPHVEERRQMDRDTKNEPTELKTKIKQVLTEARVVLPGAQALLGFQFIAMIMDGFEKLPESSKYVHLACLGLVALSTILLMTPAAYHRIVEQGEETEHFHRFSSRILLAAMVPLALGVCGDVYVVLLKVTKVPSVAVGLALALLAVCYGLWFGYTLAQRAGRERSRTASRSSERLTT